jgi:hypothetical protein
VWSALDTLNLVNQDGTAFDPSNASALDTWLQKANAQNAAYWLSAQLAATGLNVLSGKVLAGDIVYAGELLPYSSADNLAGKYGLSSDGFITVQKLILAANDALAVAPVATGGDAWRNYLLALAQTLQAVNNNTSFVQLSAQTIASLDAQFTSEAPPSPTWPPILLGGANHNETFVRDGARKTRACK